MLFSATMGLLTMVGEESGETETLLQHIGLWAALDHAVEAGDPVVWNLGDVGGDKELPQQDITIEPPGGLLCVLPSATHRYTVFALLPNVCSGTTLVFFGRIGTDERF